MAMVAAQSFGLRMPQEENRVAAHTIPGYYELLSFLVLFNQVGPNDLVLKSQPNHLIVGVLGRAANPLEDVLEVERPDISPKNE